MSSRFGWVTLAGLVLAFGCEDDPPFEGPPLSDYWEERGEPALPQTADEAVDVDAGAPTTVAEDAATATAATTTTDTSRSREPVAQSSTPDAAAPRSTDAGEALDDATPAQGTLFISTPGGWANVYDQSGDFLGQTPLVIPYPAGITRLRLRPFGNPPDRSIRVQVRPNEVSRIEFRVSGDPAP